MRGLRDDEALESTAWCFGEIGDDLTGDDSARGTGFVLCGALTDTQDGTKARIDRTSKLPGDTGVVVALVSSDLRVADDRPGREPAEHRGGDLAGKGAALLPVHVLRVHRDIGAAECVGHRGEGDRRRRDADRRTWVRARGHVAGELDRIGDVWRIHLPVADHQTFAH